MSIPLIISYLPSPAELRAMWPMWIVVAIFAALYFWSLHKERVNQQIRRMDSKSRRKLERQMREAIAASEQSTASLN